MWTYHQKTGELYHNGNFEGQGYSGMGGAKNNPDAQQLAGSGPLPQGLWKIGKPYIHEHLGPVVMNLEPVDGTNTFGRSLFRIHGDNKTHDASHGCIILGPAIRREIAGSNDAVLEVLV